MVFRLYTPIIFHHIQKEVRAGAQGRNLEAGTAREIVEEPWLLLRSPHLSQSAFLYHQDQTHSGNTNLSELGPPLSIINQENCSTLLPTGQEYGGIFSIEILSFQINVAYVKLIPTKLINK